ncbi:speckle-type POZ protein-like B [Belonocnema kinseyi]|uniref:speckle-type POZ protein-like B n=1 Tax=Belonocnema kinseyi TaxID=2817044 RepID=UPI00143DA7D9|nr:speckle-type POZ protein-like B [Belonocnema kinseyi]
MAAAIDLLEMTKMVSANNSRYPSGKDPTIYKLISVHFYSIKSSKTSSVEIILQEDPQIACTLNLLYSDECVRINMNFKSKDLSPKLKYKASLYYLNWDQKMTLLESLNMENITKDSVYHFSLPLKWFINDKDIIRKILINNHWFLYCEITRKDEIIMPRMKIENPESEMASNFSLLIEEGGQYCDVRITCGDMKFNAHKLILSARSSVFKEIFKTDMKVSKVIEITSDVEADIMDHLLRFIYSDSVNNLETGEAEKLLAAANTYMLENLKVICMKEISKSVTDIEKAFEILAIAEKYNVNGFKKIALNFIKNIGKSS